MTQLCSVCGHGIYYHVKGGQLDPKACIVGGQLCASHTFATSVNADLDPLLSKQLFPAEPILYLTGNGAVTDASGQGNDGTWSGTELYATGVVAPTTNGAMDFNGTSSYVTIDNEANFDFNHNTAFSVTLWLKSAASALDLLVSKRAGEGTIGWSVRIFSSNFEAQLEGTSGTLGINVGTTVTDVTDSAWHHLGFTYDGGGVGAGARTYIDAVNNTTITKDDLAGNSILNNDALTVGAVSGGASNFLTGQMDNLAVWDRELPPAAITALYNAGAGVTVLA